MAKNSVLNNLPEDEILWADTKRWLGLPWTFTKYRVDQDRLYCKKGFLKTETDEGNNCTYSYTYDSRGNRISSVSTDNTGAYNT